jgi:hypothetical protein
MKKTLLALAIAALASGPAAADDTQARVEASRAAAKQLFETLRDEMQTAVQSGGPVAAIEVCHDKAQALTRKVSEEKGWQVGRTSHKIRNPKNAPDAWESAVLEEFQKRKAAGEPLENMEKFAVVDEGGKKYFRYMKAIPLGGVCSNCHGPVLKPEVVEKLDKYYPDDKARGFQVGDLRGAFTIRQPM